MGGSDEKEKELSNWGDEGWEYGVYVRYVGRFVGRTMCRPNIAVEKT